jgi:hypothetical protein
MTRCRLCNASLARKQSRAPGRARLRKACLIEAKRDKARTPSRIFNRCVAIVHIHPRPSIFPNLSNADLCLRCTDNSTRWICRLLFSRLRLSSRDRRAFRISPHIPRLRKPCSHTPFFNQAMTYKTAIRQSDAASSSKAKQPK